MTCCGRQREPLTFSRSYATAPQAERAAAQLKKPLRADAFRKQLSRARRLFAKLLVQEVVQTIESPTPDRIEEELVDVGFLADVMPYLPEDWRTQLA